LSQVLPSFTHPDELIGKHIVVVANLEPARIRGVESRGMLLAGSTEDRQRACHNHSRQGHWQKGQKCDRQVLEFELIGWRKLGKSHRYTCAPGSRTVHL